MSINKTGIQWTDFTANPIRFRNHLTGEPVTWACVKVSDGCKNCYAETLALRYGKGAAYTVGNMLDLDPVLDEKVIHEMLTSKKLSGHKVFLGDMTDLFGAWVPDWMIIEIWAVAAVRPDVTLQLLTKRPECAERLIARYRPSGPGPFSQRVLRRAMELKPDLTELPWPLPNVWLGTSAENQAALDERIPHLLATPAAVRFLSLEPLLGDVFLEALEFVGPMDGPFPGGDPRRFTPDADANTSAEIAAWEASCTKWNDGQGTDRGPGCATMGDGSALSGTGFGLGSWRNESPIDWVIVGGESSQKRDLARPCNVDWIRSIVAQCQAAAVPVFVKQLGSRPYQEMHQLRRSGVGAPVGLIAASEAVNVPLKIRSRHGSDPEEWPEDLRVREFPEVQR